MSFRTGTAQRRDIVWLLLVPALFLCATGAQAAADAAPVTVRLISASKAAAKEDDAALADVLPALRDNLKFESFRLEATGKLVLEEGRSTALGTAFKVAVTAVAQENFTVTVNKNGKAVLKTRLKLVTGRPVIFGGFPGTNGEALIIVITR